MRSHRRWSKRWLGLVYGVAFTTGAVPLAGQQVGGVVGGVEMAESGAAVEGALVVVEGTVLGSVTDAAGRFQFGSVPSGSRTLRVSRIGLATVGLAIDVVSDTMVEVSLRVPEQPIALEGVEVMGRRVAERQSSAVQMLVTEGSEIARYGDATLGDILRRLPGVMVGGPPGEAKDIRLRGLDKEYTQVLVNGRRMPGGGEKREFHVDQLPAAMVERVEVIRNPRASMSAEGIAGSVNVVLKSVPPDRFFEWEIGAGNTGSSFGGNGVWDAHAHWGGTRGGFGYLMSGGYQTRATPKGKDNRDLGAAGNPLSGEDEFETKDFREWSAAPRLFWRASDRDVFTFSPLLLRQTELKDKSKDKLDAAGVVGDHETEGEEKVTTGYRLQGGWARTLGRAGEITLDLGWQGNREDKDKLKDVFKGSTLDKSETEAELKEDSEVYANLRTSLLLGGSNRLVLGIDGYIKDREKRKEKLEQKPGQDAVDKTAPKDVYEIDETVGSFFVENELRLDARNVVVAGVRGEYQNGAATDILGDRRSGSGFTLNPSLHYLRRIGGINVRAAVARTVRRPKFDDLIPYTETRDGSLTSPDKTGNPDLEPETAYAFEVGVERFLGRGGVIGVTAFYKDVAGIIRNDIVLDPASGRYREFPRNVGDGRLWGVETDVRTSLSVLGLPSTFLYGNLSFFGSEIVLDDGGEGAFAMQPDYVLNTGFDHELAGAGVRFGAAYNRLPGTAKDEIKDGRRNVDREDTGDRLDVYVAKALPGNLFLRLSGRNLLSAKKEKSKAIFLPDGALEQQRLEVETSEPVFFISFERRF